MAGRFVGPTPTEKIERHDATRRRKEGNETIVQVQIVREPCMRTIAGSAPRILATNAMLTSSSKALVPVIGRSTARRQLSRRRLSPRAFVLLLRRIGAYMEFHPALGLAATLGSFGTILGFTLTRLSRRIPRPGVEALDPDVRLGSCLISDKVVVEDAEPVPASTSGLMGFLAA